MIGWGSTLPLRYSDPQGEESTRSKLHDLDMRIQGSQIILPRRVVKQNQVASKGEYMSCKAKDKQSDCMASDYGFMRLVHRRNNPNKETLIYIPLSHVTITQAHSTRLFSGMIR